MNIPPIAVEAAQQAGDSFGLELASYDIEKLLEAAAPHIVAQALRGAARELDRMASSTDKSPYVTAGRDIIMQLRKRADQIEAPDA